MIKNRILTSLLSVFVVLLLITFSIGLPIYFRPFYYMQIDSLELEMETGLTKEEIIDGYNEVLDFLTVPGKEFGTGKFAHSPEGKSHFEDCKVLFDLNGVIFWISLIGVITLIILNRKGVFSLCRPFSSHFLLICGASTLGVFAVLGLLCSINFDVAFEVFHQIFFPGKENWVFNPYTDEIIRAMPQEFFMSCAILIASSIILVSIGFIVFGIIERKKRKEKENEVL